MEWNVYVENFNTRRIEKYNIFKHYSFLKDCVKFAKIKDITKQEFAEKVKRSLSYFFWCKCEWEIILSAWPPREDFREEKIDVYSQVCLNFDIFIDYLWNHKQELIKEKI